ncbi:MAG: BrnA antitoxin family protein [Alphaproteobacteria bacterium]|nr:MAG: BrnA antitoxin family protein [Alphaproteobacteria bacterium]
MSKAEKPRRYADDAPLTEAELKRMRPAREAMPDLVAAYERGELRYRGQRGPQKAPVKRSQTLRLSPEVLDFFKAKGSGWQTRIDDALLAIVRAAR